ncbi:hypothetical protein ACRAWD_09210 [Caulobacter segnis]
MLKDLRAVHQGPEPGRRPATSRTTTLLGITGQRLSAKLDGNWEVGRGASACAAAISARRARAVHRRGLYSPRTRTIRRSARIPAPITAPIGRARTPPRSGRCARPRASPARSSHSYTYANTQVNALTGGNPDLKEEKADTYNVGPGLERRALQPPAAGTPVDVARLLLDRREGRDRQLIDASTAPDKRYSAAGNPSGSASNYYCSLFVRSSSTGEIDTLTPTNLNLAEYKTSGVDFQVDWGFGLGGGGSGTTATARSRSDLIGSYLDSFKVQSARRARTSSS